MRLLVLVILLATSVYANAQSPQAINYQAVARSASGAVLPTQGVAIRFSILEGSASGAVLYQETHQTTTNSFGLFTLSIGTGSIVSGTFSNINWASGTSKFLRVEIATDGTANYQLQGTTQLLSVPYALYAAKTTLVAGNGISITNGNTIAGNYQAGAGISISGNVISSSTNNLWVPDANGIHNASGGVGIGSNAHSIYPLNVRQPNTGLGYGIAQFESEDSWHAAVAIKSNTSNRQYSFIVGGSSNNELKPTNFGILNGGLIKWSLVIDGATNNIGFGSPSVVTPVPKSTVHVLTGDVNIEQIGSGIILKSPNGQCWRVTIDNSGNFVRTAITCP